MSAAVGWRTRASGAGWGHTLSHVAEKGHQLQAAMDVELPENALDVRPDGWEGDPQCRGDRLGGFPTGEQPQDLAFAEGQGQEAPGDLGPALGSIPGEHAG